MVWVDLDGGRGRTLLHCGDGVEILPARFLTSAARSSSGTLQR